MPRRDRHDARDSRVTIEDIKPCAFLKRMCGGYEQPFVQVRLPASAKISSSGQDASSSVVLQNLTVETSSGFT